MGKVTRIPIKYMERKKNMMGKGYVPCQVSGRYFNVHTDSVVLQGGEFVTIDVMTEETKDDNPKKICGLIVTKEDLLKALNEVTPK